MMRYVQIIKIVILNSAIGKKLFFINPPPLLLMGEGVGG